MKKPLLYVPFISQSGLENLRKYKYSGVDKSLCARLFLNAYWERVVALMPRWLAPNAITLAGGVFCFAAAALAMVLAPTYRETVPRWACLVYALCIFFYQTMDNIDGKQARRTGAGSPLGELFDHGVDALVMGMFVLVVASVLGGGGYATVLAGTAVLAPFYLSHWEEYHAGVLVMGELTGPTEMQVAVMLLLALVAATGAAPWVSHARLLLLACAAGAAAMCAAYVRAVVRRVRARASVHPVARPAQALAQVAPFAAWLACALLWAATTRDTVDAHPAWYLVANTLAFGAVTQQLIAQRICGEPIAFNRAVFVPYGVAALYGVLRVAGIASFINGTYVLVFVLAASLFIETVFVASVIYQLSSFLEIRPFHITPKASSQ